MSFYEFLDLMTYASPILLGLGVLLAIYFWHDLNKQNKGIGIYFLIGIIADIVSRKVSLPHGHNLIIIPLFGLFELMIFGWLYLNTFDLKRKPWMFPFLLFGLVLIISDLLGSIDSNAEDFQSYGRVIDGLFILIYAVYFYIEKMKSEEKINSELFLTNGVILLFFSLNLLFFLPLNFLVNVKSEVKFYFWLANFVITIAFYIYLLSRVWKFGRTQRQLRLG